MPEEVLIFTTVFLGIFIEAAPFLLLGTFASGFVEVFISRDDMAKIMPKGILPATLMGGLLGFAFPVCECGVVPLTRRLFRKGLPVSAGIAFLLAAPTINPIALAATYAAYGFGDVLLLRFLLGLSIPMFIGFVFAMGASPIKILLPRSYAASVPAIMGASENFSDIQRMDALNIEQPKPTLGEQLQRATRIASNEFFEMGRYLVLGSILAALMQTYISQEDILSLGNNPFSSVVFMQVLAFVLSVCSTVDAFISLSFVNTFSTGSILGFLVFGPMADIKSTLMYLNVFKRNVVFYIIALAFLSTLLVTVFINLNFNI
ncbi:MAG: permease [Chloroflexi bacterium]|nr:MAG: permease [Chloroflexota bacterium]